MGAAKKQDEPLLEVVELPTDREQGLSKNFEDPQLEELIPGMTEPSARPALTIVETTEAAPVPQASQTPSQESIALDLTAGFSEPFVLGEPVETPMPEGTESLPVPEAPALALAAPDRSLLLAVPPDAIEEEAAKVVSIPAPAARPRSDAGFRMAEAIFALVACEKSFDEMVNTALLAIMEAVGAHAGSVLELDHEHEDFFFRASSGGATSVTALKAFRVPLTKGIVGHVAESGEPLLIRDLSEDQMQMRAISMGVGFEARTCMAAPILVGGQPYGVIEMFNRVDGGLFEKDDLRTLEEGVRMLAKVLEVRFLLAELSRRLRA